MATQTNDPQPLPVACTLGPEDGATRMAEWREVAVAATGRSLERGKLSLRFRDEPTVGAKLKRLVASERDCCAFLGWELVRADNEWRVEITGSDAELRALSLAQ